MALAVPAKELHLAVFNAAVVPVSILTAKTELASLLSSKALYAGYNSVWVAFQSLASWAVYLHTEKTAATVKPKASIKVTIVHNLKTLPGFVPLTECYISICFELFNFFNYMLKIQQSF